MDRKTIKQLGKENMKKQWGELLLALVLFEAVLLLASALTIGVGALVITGPLQFGVTYLYYKSTQGETVDQTMLLRGFKDKFGESFLAGLFVSILQSIPLFIGGILFMITIVGMISSLAAGIQMGAMGYDTGYSTGAAAGFGSILLLLVGIVLNVAVIFIYYGICLSIYILVREPGSTAVKALKKSWAIMKGQKLRMFVFDLSYIGWFILSMILFFIPLIWVAPYYKSSKTILMTDIYDNSGVADDPDFDLKGEFKDIKGMVGGIKTTEQEQPQESHEAQGSSGEAEAAVEEGPIYCAACGAEVRKGAKFCNKCGTPV